MENQLRRFYWLNLLDQLLGDSKVFKIYQDDSIYLTKGELGTFSMKPDIYLFI